MGASESRSQGDAPMQHNNPASVHAPSASPVPSLHEAPARTASGIGNPVGGGSSIEGFAEAQLP